MSILLTAAAKKKFMKKLKSKGSSDNLGSACASGPPGTTELTTVWYWLLNGVTTTVMYNRDSTEIWCNGSNIDIQKPRYDPSLGYAYDFLINLPEAQSCHQAKLIRMDDGRYMLYVDGYVINEYYK